MPLKQCLDCEYINDGHCSFYNKPARYIIRCEADTKEEKLEKVFKELSERQKPDAVPSKKYKYSSKKRTK